MSRIAFLVGLLTMLAGCAAGPYMVPVPSPSTAPLTPSPSPSPPEWEGVVLIGEILAQPKEYLGRQVTLTAYYRGWDLFGEAGSGPPLTRSDVAVADATGGIYVVPAGEGAFAGLPRLAPFDRASTEVLLRLSGKVQANAAGQPYVLVSKAEALEGLPAQVLLRARRTGGLAGLDQNPFALARRCQASAAGCRGAERLCRQGSRFTSAGCFQLQHCGCQRAEGAADDLPRRAAPGRGGQSA